MKGMFAGDLESCRPSWCLRLLRMIAALVLVLLACCVVLGVLGAIVVRSLIAGAAAILASLFAGLPSLLFGVVWMAIRLSWMVLQGDWNRLARALPELLEWLRSFNLL